MATRRKLMTREEMLARLDAGEHPAVLSLEKWYRVRAYRAWGV